MKGLTWMLLIMLASFFIAGLWNYPVVKNSIHAVLDPTAGLLLNWNKNLGMIIIVFVITLIITLVQKYATDQESLKRLREEQKILQQEMKKYKNHPEKLVELQKKQLEFLPRTFELTSRSLVYTFVPIVLFFRWFNDILAGYKFFNALSWFWVYLILSLVFSSVLRKILKVV